jgi:hypothetical protein
MSAVAVDADKTGTPLFRRQLGIVLAIVLFLAVGLRIALVVSLGQDTFTGSIVFSNADLARNLLHGNGYVHTISDEANTALETRGSKFLAPAVPLEEWLEVYSPGPPIKPSAYHMPGLPFMAAAVWGLLGQETYTSVQIVHGVLDGIFGPLAVFLLLSAARLRRAGIWGALAYAVQPPVVYLSTRFLPDALSAMIPLLALAVLVVAIQRRQMFWAVAVAGAVLGLAGWTRSDYVSVLLMFIPLIFIAGEQTLARKAAMVAVLLLAWAIPTAGLSAFYTQTYGEFHLTRPGVGIQLWAAIGQQDNPWGIEAPPGRNIDAAATTLVLQNGHVPGTWEADAFLFQTALSHMRDRPLWFVKPTVTRFFRVTGMHVPIGPLWFRIAIGLAVVPLAAIGLKLLCGRSRLIALGVLAVWASRVLPFSFLNDQLRYVIVLVPLYSMLIAVVLDHVLSRVPIRLTRSGWRAVRRPASPSV